MGGREDRRRLSAGSHGERYEELSAIYCPAAGLELFSWNRQEQNKLGIPLQRPLTSTRSTSVFPPEGWWGALFSCTRYGYQVLVGIANCARTLYECHVSSALSKNRPVNLLSLGLCIV